MARGGWSPVANYRLVKVCVVHLYLIGDDNKH